MQNNLIKKNSTPVQKITAENPQAAAITDNRPEAALQRKQMEGMAGKPATLQCKTSSDAPIQLAKWKYQKPRGWVLMSGVSSSTKKPFPPGASEGDIFDDQTGVLTPASPSPLLSTSSPYMVPSGKPVHSPLHGTSTMGKVPSSSPVHSVSTTRTVSSGMPVQSPLVPTVSAPGPHEVRLRQTQQMRGGPDLRYNSDHEVDSKFSILVNTSAKTCQVIIRIQSTASKSVFSNWAGVTDAKWSNRFGLRVMGSGSSLSGFYMITVKLVQVPSHENPHHVVVPQLSSNTFSDIRGMKGTRSMTEWGTEDAVDVPHEVGHMLGNLDEYYTINGKKYTGPGEDARKGVDIGEGSIMNDPKNNPLERHYELIRKEAAMAIGVPDENVTLEEATSQVQSSTPSRSLPRPGLSGGISMSSGMLSGAIGGLKKTTIPSSQPKPMEDAPVFDFRSVLRKPPAMEKSPKPIEETTPVLETPVFSSRQSLTKPLLSSPVPSSPLLSSPSVSKSSPRPPLTFSSGTVKKAPSRPLSTTVDQPPPLSTGPLKKAPPKPLPTTAEQPPVTDFRSRLRPVSERIIKPPSTEPVEETVTTVSSAPKPKRQLPEPPKITTVKPEKEVVVEPPPIEERQAKLKNAFNRLGEILAVKLDEGTHGAFLEERNALLATFRNELGRTGLDVFYADGHWGTVKQRIMDILNRANDLPDLDETVNERQKQLKTALEKLGKILADKVNDGAYDTFLEEKEEVMATLKNERANGKNAFYTGQSWETVKLRISNIINRAKLLKDK